MGGGRGLGSTPRGALVAKGQTSGHPREWQGAKGPTGEAYGGVLLGSGARRSSHPPGWSSDIEGRGKIRALKKTLNSCLASDRNAPGWATPSLPAEGGPEPLYTLTSAHRGTPMATADQVKALIRSHTEGDNTRFYSIAMQVAAQAARNGHGKLAQELRELIEQAQLRAARGSASSGLSLKPVPLAQPRGELAGLLTAVYPKARLSDLALEEGLQARLERVLLEQRQRARLSEHGFRAMEKLLLVGPPGTGKTMTAAALAGELGLPLFTIQLDGLITKFMGETAAKLRLVFDAMQITRGVYLFDEFDALGGERGAKNDVGEIRRVLNSFLQFLEQDEPDSLIIGATNHAALLDKALFRRFDAVLEYNLPTDTIAEQVMRGRLATLDTSGVDWPRVVEAAQGLSHAEIARACEQAAKNAILASTMEIRHAELQTALLERRATHPR